MKALIDGKVRTLKEIVGEGGEALVYAVDGGRVAKIAKETCNEAKVTALMQLPLPGCVVAPQALVRDPSGAKVIGYTMPRVPNAEALSKYAVPDVRTKGFGTEDALELLQQMHADLRAIHRAGLVVGDLNDTNVLLSGKAPRWIDADSYALPGFACTVFSERYLDPRLMDATGMLAQPYDEGSDWYAFCVIALELLLFVGPYSGVEPGKTLRDRIARRSTIFSSAVKRPKAMAPLAALSSELSDALESVLARDVRSFDAALLRARVLAVKPVSAPIPTGRLRVRTMTIVPRVPDFAVEIRGDRLRAKRTNAHPLLDDAIDIGTIVSERANVWLGTSFGLVLMRVSPLEGTGTLTMGAVFRPDRRGMNDGLRFPAIRGRIRELACTFSDDHAWLFYEREEAGRRLRGCYLVSSKGEHVAWSEGAPWIERSFGHAALGRTLFAPSDDGIVRVEAQNGALVATRTFHETAPYVSTESQLSCQPDGIAVAINPHTLRVLSLEETP